MSLRVGWLLGAALVAACGGAEAVEVETTGTTGGEVVERPPSTGPVQSYVGPDHRVVVRLDMEAVRSSSLSADIGSLLRTYPTWRDLLGSSGIDPVRDFDRVLVVAPAAVSDRSLLLIRHHLSTARVREAVLAMAVERGEHPEWREVEGFSVVDWPAETPVPRVVVLTAEHEMVVTTPEDLDRVITVAIDHAGRRDGDVCVEPALELEAGVIASVVADEVRGAGRLRHPPDAFEVVIRRDAERRDRILLAAQGTYADAQAAQTAQRYYAQQRDDYAGQMLVRAVGLDRPLRETRIELRGNVVDVRASMTEEEIQRILGLMAFAQIGGG